MPYLAIKHLHVTCVVLSISLFLLRANFALWRPERLQEKTWRIAPHIVDTVLLGSALTLAWQSSQYPFVQSWLTAKVLALCLYIVLGAIALKRAQTRRGKLLATFAATGCFAYIVAVAISRSPTLGVF